jgi:signal recognition particle GTPase
VSRIELDDAVRALLETQLDSFEKLEIMQALRASGQSMSQQEVAAACQLRSDVVEDTLDDLERAQLITRERRRRIRTGSGCTDPRFVVLMQLYAEDRAGVLAALSSVAVQRIRSMAATAFADAFAHKKRGNGD